jgi:hypothetical protein
MRSTTIMIFSTCLLLGVHSDSFSQSAPSTLHGTVRVAAGAGGATSVRLQLQQFSTTIQEMFVREGRFEFRNIEQGRYTIIADAPGYETVREDVNVPGDWTVIDLHPPREGVQRAEVLPIWELRIPESARRQFEAAKSKLQQNDCVDALDHLKKAVHAFAQMSQFDAAEQELKQALEQPHRPELHLLLAKVYAREGKRSFQERQLQLFADEKPNQQAERR